MTGYEFKTMKWLFEQYIYENGRKVQGEARINKEMIREELQRRLDAAFAHLEQCDNEKQADIEFISFINGWDEDTRATWVDAARRNKDERDEM